MESPRRTLVIVAEMGDIDVGENRHVLVHSREVGTWFINDGVNIVALLNSVGDRMGGLIEEQGDADGD